MKKRWKALFRQAAGPLGQALARGGIPANAVTVAGVLAAFAAAYGFLHGIRWLAFGALLGSGICDLVDGAVARAGGKRGTPLGAVLDSALDRYGEGLILGAILIRWSSQSHPGWPAILAVLAWIGSFLVSYVRARSESLGIPCEIGLLERPERWVFLLILALWGDRGVLWVLGTLAFFTHVTFLQRLHHIHRTAAGLGSLPGSGAAEPVGPLSDSEEGAGSPDPLPR